MKNPYTYLNYPHTSSFHINANISYVLNDMMNEFLFVRKVYAFE